MDFHYTEHVLMRMDEREIELDWVETAIRECDIIRHYSGDKPFPSALYLAFIGNRALHIVAAQKGVDSYIVITAYWPEAAGWSADFRIKKQ